MPLFSPGVDDEAVAQFLHTAPAAFQESMLRPGLIHSLPAGIADLLLPKDSLHRQPWEGVAPDPAFAASLGAGAGATRGARVSDLTDPDTEGTDTDGVADEEKSPKQADSNGIREISVFARPSNHHDKPASASASASAAAAAGFTKSLVALPACLTPTKEALWASGFVGRVYRQRLTAALARADTSMRLAAPKLQHGAVVAGLVAMLLLLVSRRARHSSANQALALLLGTPATAAVCLAVAAALAHRWPSLRRALVAVLMGNGRG